MTADWVARVLTKFGSILGKAVQRFSLLPSRKTRLLGQNKEYVV